jgi:3-hydroxybutyryl-CoA dehydrogenase
MEASSAERVGIVGSGTMGSRIAYQCALSGRAVNLFDVRPEALERAMSEIGQWLESAPEHGKRQISYVHPCDTLAACVAGVGLVIETVPEDLELKRQVFAEIDRLAPAGVRIATNSSSFPSSQLAAATRRPDRVFNVNFTDPLAGELLVEVMGHAGTSAETLEAGECFVRSIGMVPIVTRREIMGFAFNRVWRAIKRECLHLVADGYAGFEDLDRAWILTFGTRTGPFAMMDEIGLDVVRDIELNYYAESGDERDKPPAFLDEFVSRGRLGVKSGRGFYSYPDPECDSPGWLRKVPPWTGDQAVGLD